MAWKFDNSSPIYLQIVQKLKSMIVSGEYKAGDKLPTVRDMAVEIGVNPNTMQRAFAELEKENLVVSQRTTGRFITTDEEVIKVMKMILARNTVTDFLSSMKALGLSTDDIIQMIKFEK